MLTGLPGSLSPFLARLPGYTSGCLTNVADSLSRGLPELLAEATDSLADPAERLAGAAGDLPYCTTWPQRLSGGVAQPT